MRVTSLRMEAGESSPAMKEAEKELLHYFGQVKRYEGDLHSVQREIKLQEKKLEENRSVSDIMLEQLQKGKNLKECSTRKLIGKRFYK